MSSIAAYKKKAIVTGCLIKLHRLQKLVSDKSNNESFNWHEARDHSKNSWRWSIQGMIQLEISTWKPCGFQWGASYMLIYADKQYRTVFSCGWILPTVCNISPFNVIRFTSHHLGTVEQDFFASHSFCSPLRHLLSGSQQDPDNSIVDKMGICSERGHQWKLQPLL